MSRVLLVLLAALSLSADPPIAPAVSVNTARMLSVWRSEPLQFVAATSDFRGNETARFALSTITTPYPGVSIATDGDGFLVVWAEADATRTLVRGAVVHDGAAQTFTISTDLDVTYQGTAQVPVLRAPIAGWDGSRYRVFWLGRGPRTLFAAVSSQGVIESVREVPGVQVRGVGFGPRFLLVESAIINGSITLRAMFLEESLTVTEPVTLAQTAVSTGFGSTWLYLADVAWNGSEYYVVWDTGRSGRYETLAGTRLTIDGTPLDEATLSTWSGSPGFTKVKIWPAGSLFFATWAGPNLSSHHLQGAWIDAGAVSKPFTLQTPNYPELVATVVLFPNGDVATVSVENDRLVVRPRHSSNRRRVGT